ncbi:MAG: ADP-ribosylglycohydrolase family protein [Fibrobacteria bacterium]|nr:ADP-ribosylglycohydrolase family protein [Fibrobacteria bacterium]
MPSAPDRLRGGFWGLLVGDALGVPYEFTPPQRLPERRKLDMEPPVAFLRSHHGIKPGTWSDDGAQALCLLESLLEKDAVDPRDLMDRICRWFRDGHLAVGRDVFDVGMQTSRSISKFLEGVPAMSCGRTDEQGNGNGSLMRSLPLALWHVGTDEELVSDARLLSRPTHAHPRSELCCALYCLWARRLADTTDHPWMEAVEILEGLFPRGTREREEIDAEIRPREEYPAKGSGYVVDSLQSARIAMRERSFEDVVRAAVAFGHDTDTTACIAGGVAGIRYGIRGIPKRWLKTLRGRDLAEPLLARLEMVRERAGKQESGGGPGNSTPEVPPRG